LPRAKQIVELVDEDKTVKLLTGRMTTAREEIEYGRNQGVTIYPKLLYSHCARVQLTVLVHSRHGIF